MANPVSSALDAYSVTSGIRRDATANKSASLINKSKGPKSDIQTSSTDSGLPTSMKKGGTVKKTGLIKMHKGEKVIPASKAKKSSSKKK